MPPEKGVKPCLCGAATGDQHSSERGTHPPLNPNWLPLHQVRRWFLGLFDNGWAWAPPLDVQKRALGIASNDEGGTPAKFWSWDVPQLQAHTWVSASERKAGLLEVDFASFLPPPKSFTAFQYLRFL